VFGLAGFLIFGMRDHYVALTDRRLIFINASFWTSRPPGDSRGPTRGTR
jgi:hypothetical protein